ncbi:MAG: KamA family radical SAM protein [Candidatus Omnitrophota bacterium]|jgi:lysine 2,3-aminomutase
MKFCDKVNSVEEIIVRATPEGVDENKEALRVSKYKNCDTSVSLNGINERSKTSERVDSQDEEPEECKAEILSEENWYTAYLNSLKNIDDLSKFISIPEEEKPILKQVIKTFHVRVPLYYLSLVKKMTDPHDPIRRQCIPSVEEIEREVHEKIDPLGEEKNSPAPCLVHRYPDRALLIVTGRCFMYCRHCTRKRLWRSRIPEPTLKDIDLALTYVKENKEIREVIVSGGDPLTLPTEKIDYILSNLSDIKSVEVIRIGTRALAVFPQRIDENLCKVLAKYENLWINTQFNHPNEITSQSVLACKKLQRCGIVISNQSVLLKGINDNVKTMLELCHKLQNIRVRPYYLYQCDPVVGAHHFRTSIWRGIDILENMRGHTSGMCIPTFVVDGIDGKGKIPISPNYVLSVSPDGLTLRNYKNETLFYFNPKE